MAIQLQMAPTDLNFQTTRNENAKTPAERETILADPGFGKFFSDHMVDICWSEAGGLAPPTRAAVRIDRDGSRSRRACTTARRSSRDSKRTGTRTAACGRSARRRTHTACSAPLVGSRCPNCLSTTSSTRSSSWCETTSTGFRPAVRRVSTCDRSCSPRRHSCGVRAAKKVNYYVIASPAGAYFPGGVAPVSIWLSADYARAGKGGTGAAKTGGNYASILIAQQEAYEHGCAQVLFLDSEENEYLEELGGMNVVLVHKDGTLITPESSSILEGITLDSILQLARDRGLATEMRRVSIQERRDEAATGNITEVFACGTAAVITPIAELKAANFSIGSPDAPAGELTISLRDELLDIQYGRKEDPHDWMMRLDA